MTPEPLRIAALLTTAALSACFAEVDAPQVSLSHTLCPLTGPACLPGGGAPLSVIPIGASRTFEVALGPLQLPAEKKGGPVRLAAEVRLRGASLAVVGSPGASLSGVARLELVQASPADPACATPQGCRVLARYDHAVDGLADRALRLRADGIDLLELSRSQTKLVLLLRAAGTAPAPATWNAEVGIDVDVRIRASAP
jgi:hypothetical protein